MTANQAIKRGLVSYVITLVSSAVMVHLPLDLIYCIFNSPMPISNVKAILSGNSLELYEYSRPFLYGVPLHRKSRKKPRHVFKIITERSLWHTKKTLRRLLMSNAGSYMNEHNLPFKPIFITFTFKENIIDLTMANNEWTKFIKRFNKRYFRQGYLKYVGVPEFQKRGAVHYHVVFFNLPYMPRIYDVIRDNWGLGFTLVETIKSTEHLVNYVSKYLSKENFDQRLFGRKKYFASRGLFKPRIARDPELVELIRSLSGSKMPEYQSRLDVTEFNLEILYQKFKVLDPAGLLPWLEFE